MRQIINWKTFLVLLGLSLVSVVCVFPYVLTLQGELLKNTGIPIGVIFLIQLIQGAILFAIAIFLGLWFIQRTKFQLPLIEAIVDKGDSTQVLKSILSKSIILGTVTAVVIYGADALFTRLGAAITTHQSYAPVWQKLLAAVYGGITEEILLRLFVMSFLIWIGMKLFKHSRPTPTVIWVAVIIAAVLFGLGHLPITASLTTLTPLVIGRAVVLNGIGGVVFGWLFWKHGLESAMIAHFTTDIFLLTLLPLILK